MRSSAFTERLQKLLPRTWALVRVRRRRAEDPHEGLVPVKGPVGLLCGGGRLPRGQARVEGGEDAAAKGHHMGREGEGDLLSGQQAQLALDLKDALVARYLVGVHGLVAGGKVKRGGRVLSGARNTGLGVADDGLRVHQALVHGRGQPENAAHGEAARVSHHAGPGDLVAVEFGQAVSGLRKEVRGCVLLRAADSRGVAALHVGRVEPEVPAVIDDLDPAVEPRRSLGLSHAVRCGKEDHVHILGAFGFVGRCDDPAAEPLEVGVEVAVGPAHVLLVDQGGDLPLRVLAQDLNGSAAAIPSGADDADANTLLCHVPTSFPVVHELFHRNRNCPIKNLALDCHLVYKNAKGMFRAYYRRDVLNKRDVIEYLKKRAAEPIPGKRFRIERFAPDYAWGIAGLFYAVYGDGYPIDTYYLPDRMTEKNSSGQIFSLIAVNESRQVVGYGALYRSSSPYPGTYEIGQYIVHPSYRNTSIAFKINAGLITLAHEAPEVEVYYGETVCTHLITQKMADRDGVPTSAIELGLMPEEAYDAQAGVTGRVSANFMFKELKTARHQVFVPNQYKKEIDLIFSDLNLDRRIEPAPNITVPAVPTGFSIDYFDFARVSRVCVRRIGNDFPSFTHGIIREARQKNVVILQLFINAADPAVQVFVEHLREHGFFFEGFLRRWFDTDCYLMQKDLSPFKLSDVKLYSDKSKRMLEYIMVDRERAEMQ